MRHRMGMAAMTGLGNPSPVLLNNKGTLTPKLKRMMKDAMKLYKPLEYGVDFQFMETGIAFGREPAYQYEELCIIYLSKNKSKSYVQTGKAFDSYGSGIRSRFKLYGEYKYNSKFKRFVDKWYPVFLIAFSEKE